MPTIKELREMLDRLGKRQIFANYLVTAGKLKQSEIEEFIIGRNKMMSYADDYSEKAKIVREVFPQEFINNPHLLNESNINLYADKLWADE